MHMKFSPGLEYVYEADSSTCTYMYFRCSTAYFDICLRSGCAACGVCFPLEHVPPPHLHQLELDSCIQKSRRKGRRTHSPLMLFYFPMRLRAPGMTNQRLGHSNGSMFLPDQTTTAHVSESHHCHQLRNSKRLYLSRPQNLTVFSLFLTCQLHSPSRALVLRLSV
jgi:hypothetical protein